ncbi:MAG: cytochrome-c oxidase, cbb3-type subunit III [Rhodobacteraceae bacterium]|nr:cytochrome-c oxidase, cbb3-type subunit III [Paracoccaceae bacterium]
MAKKPEKKEVETTGHIWDGIEEYNNPLPRWWLTTTYLTIIWGIGYIILYPAIPLPGGATPGVLGYSSRAEVQKDIDEVNERNAPLVERVNQLELAAIASDEEVGGFAINGGEAVFKTFCAQCHGSGAAGSPGYPNLADDEWLWGGTIEDIYETISVGIRDEANYDTRISQMPAFGADELLGKEEISTLVSYVGSLSGINGAGAAEAAAGEQLYLESCAACHGDNGEGDSFGGAPNLTDAIWLYGSDVAALTETISNSRFGVMPAWSGRLSESQIRQASVYIHALGGGE